MRTRVWGCVVLLAGCASVQTNPAAAPTPRAGDSEGPPSLEGLPSSDVPDAGLTREMRTARRLSEESLNLGQPAAPASRSAEAVSDWSEHTLGPWLERKQSSAQAARLELDRAAAQSERQRIMAGAMVGLVYEDLVRALLSVPSPKELDSEPEIKAIHREVVFKQATPYLMHAKLGYDACAANAKSVPSLAHWSSFCSARSEQLPPLEESAPGANGQTDVSVTRE